MATYKEREAALEKLGYAFLEAISKAERIICPRCGIAGGIAMTYGSRAVTLTCAMPVPGDVTDENAAKINDVCGFQMVLYMTTANELPEPKFTEVKHTAPAPQTKAKVKTNPRSRTSMQR